MRVPLGVLLAVVLLGAVACDDPPVAAATTSEALSGVEPVIAAIDGVARIDRLAPDDSSGVVTPTIVSGSIIVEPAVDGAGARRIAEEAAGIVWRSDAPVIDAILLDVKGPGLQSLVLLDDVIGGSDRAALEDHFGARP